MPWLVALVYDSISCHILVAAYRCERDVTSIYGDYIHTARQAVNDHFKQQIRNVKYFHEQHTVNLRINVQSEIKPGYQILIDFKCELIAPKDHIDNSYCTRPHSQ